MVELIKTVVDISMYMLGVFVAGIIFLFCVGLLFFTIVLMAYIVKEIIEEWKEKINERQ